METYNGTYLVMLVETSAGNYKPIAHATGHSIDISRETRPTSSKSVGVAAGKEYGRYEGSGTVDALISMETNFVNLAWFRAAIVDGTKIKILSVLLDYQTSGKAPLSDSAEIVVRDAGDDGNIDDATTTIETTADNFALTSVFSTMTPEAAYFQAVITGVGEASNDGETATFSVSFESDGNIQFFATGAFA